MFAGFLVTRAEARRALLEVGTDPGVAERMVSSRPPVPPRDLERWPATFIGYTNLVAWLLLDLSAKGTSLDEQQ